MLQELLRSKGAAGEDAGFTSSTDGFSGSAFTGSEMGREAGFKCAICLVSFGILEQQRRESVSMQVFQVMDMEVFGCLFLALKER